MLHPQHVDDVGVLDVLDINWGVLVGDRDGGDLAWELAATRLDRVDDQAVVEIVVEAEVALMVKLETVSYTGCPKKPAFVIFGENFSKIFFFQIDSLGVFLCEKLIARIEKP